MKIAFITNLCPHYRYKLFSLLASKYSFDFYFFEDPKKTKEDIKHLEIYRKGERFNYLSLAEIFRKLLKNRYNVIIKCTNNKWSFLCSFIISKLINARFIVWHTIWYYPQTLQYRLFSSLFLTILKHFSDAIVVYGEHGKRFLMEKSINPDKIFIAWQTVDNEIFGRNVNEEEIRNIKRKFNIPEGKKIILYVGRFKKLKGINYLLEALDKLDKSKFLFIAIGYGDLEDYMTVYCKDKGIDYRLVELVPYHALPPYYKLANFLVLPSITTKTLKECWGMVVNEAFNQGCPVVVTDAVGAGMGGLVCDGVNGFVVSEKNSNKLTEAMAKILFDDGLRQHLSRNALEEIEGWTYERQAQGFLDAVKYAIKG